MPHNKTTAPYSPQSNGVTEQKNYTLKEMIDATLITFGLPQNMWGEAILTANYLLNEVFKKKQKRLHISYGKEESHPINTCECGDVGSSST